MRIGDILTQIDLGAIALPEFQRGYVWNRDQVRGLMTSLYQRHPVGSLLVWVTKTENADAKGDGPLPPGYVKLLLDGQQRITSLYGIIKGKPPQFFDGNQDVFTGLYFNLEDEAFEFYGPLKMRDNPLWVSVTQLMQEGPGPFINRLVGRPELAPNLTTYVNRLMMIDGIKNVDLHIEEVAGEDKTVDVVVDIFNKVNSGGTKLSKGDLALARICASWPDARNEMKHRLAKWSKAGFHFKLDWLLRCINALITGESMFAALKDVDTPTFQRGLVQTERFIDQSLNLIAWRLGLDHDGVLGSRYTIPVMARYLKLRGGQLADYRERDLLLYWYIHTMLWGRYSGTVETVMNQDLAAIEGPAGGLDRLIGLLRQNRGDLHLESGDFAGWSRNARFYPLLYMLTRVWHARDWESGVELTSHLLGGMSQLEVHHIFPKALLYRHGFSKADANAIANFTFLTKFANLKVSDRSPAEYLAEFGKTQPGAVESHWIPMDPELWEVENYPAFLAARRELLATAANQFLDSLIGGSVPEPAVSQSILDREVAITPGGITTEAEEEALHAVNGWVIAQQLPAGELRYELVNPETKEPIAVLDLAWPEGLQPGLSQPVALLIDESPETIEAANQAGFRYFTDPAEFREYVRRDILALGLVPA